MIFRIFLFVPFISFSQQQISNGKGILSPKADCNLAEELIISKNETFKIKSPKGFGGIQEIKKGQPNVLHEGEHNSSWHILSIQVEGELLFEIVPEDSTNDLDFVLFSYADSTFCNSIRIPVRNNISKNSPKGSGATGLSNAAKENFTAKGKGGGFSRSLIVNKGMVFMLLVDNLNSSGKGYSLNISVNEKLEISGIVTSFSKLPLSAEVSLVDKSNRTLVKASTDPQTGAYYISSFVKKNEYYCLVFNSDSYFPEALYVSTKNLEFKNKIICDRELKELKVGETYTLAYYSYQQHVFVLYEELYPLYALANLLKKHPQIKAVVTIRSDEKESEDWNGEHDTSVKTAWEQNKISSPTGIKETISLSEWRKRNFISQLRQINVVPTGQLTFIASEKLLITNPKSKEEHRQNSQISIKILSF